MFNKEYPELNRNGQAFAKVIDNYMTYAQSAIDEFSEPDKMPQIAISVDMLDTGIDVPQVLNLVFSKGNEQGQILADDRKRHPFVSGSDGWRGQRQVLYF